jgi:hypothetical protein
LELASEIFRKGEGYIHGRRKKRVSGMGIFWADMVLPN